MPVSKLKKFVVLYALALFFSLSWYRTSHAAGPGDPDTSFGEGGVVTTSITSGPDSGFSVALQPDGKIIAGGTSFNGVTASEGDFAVIRYKNDGALDASFNGSGIVTVPLRSGVGTAVALGPDGKIIQAGSSNNGDMLLQPDHDFALVRYESNGILDATFNSTGIVTTNLGGNRDFGRAVVLQPDGNIVVAGSSNIGGGDSRFAVVRYTVTGTLDSSFSGGIVTTAVGNRSGGAAVALQPDGKVVVGGVSDNNFAVVRYQDDGTLDTSFNGTGIVTTSINIQASATSVVLQSDGKIVVAGNSGNGSFIPELTVVRYSSNGSLDTEFNSTGIVTISIGNWSSGNAVTLQPDGKIVVAGSANFSTGTCLGDLDFALVRYTPNGTLDPMFKNNGIVTTPISVNNDGGFDVVVQPDGKIVVVGNMSDCNGSNFAFAMVRYLEDKRSYLPLILKKGQ